MTTRKENNSTVNKLSSIAGVKPTTYKMGAKVLNSDNEDVKQRVLSGATSISAGYKELTQRKEEKKALIETNIRQRGDIGGSDKQIGKRIKELERIYGSKVGRPKNSEKNSELSPQEKIAQKMDMDVRTLRNYKMLAELVPELQDWVETGILAPTTV